MFSFSSLTKLGLIATLLCSLNIQQTNAQQYQDGLSMISALRTAFNTSSYYNSSGQYGFVGNECLLGAFIQDGRSASFRYYLQAGREYVFVGGGDQYATDLDIYVKDSYGQVLAQDELVDNAPIVSFTPPSTGQYTVELTLYDCSTNGSYSILTALTPGGYYFPAGNLEAYINNVYPYWQDAYVNTNGNMWFAAEPNQWCMFGSVLTPSSSSVIENISFGNHNTALLSVSDGFSNDVDVCLLDGGGQELVCDAEVDADAVVEMYTSSGQRYGVKTTNYEGQNSFIITAAFGYE